MPPNGSSAGRARRPASITRIGHPSFRMDLFCGTAHFLSTHVFPLTRPMAKRACHLLQSERSLRRSGPGPECLRLSSSGVARQGHVALSPGRPHGREPEPEVVDRGCQWRGGERQTCRSHGLEGLGTPPNFTGASHELTVRLTSLYIESPQTPQQPGKNLTRSSRVILRALGSIGALV